MDEISGGHNLLALIMQRKQARFLRPQLKRGEMNKPHTVIQRKSFFSTLGGWVIQVRLLLSQYFLRSFTFHCLGWMCQLTKTVFFFFIFATISDV